MTTQSCHELFFAEYLLFGNILDRIVKCSKYGIDKNIHVIHQKPKIVFLVNISNNGIFRLMIKEFKCLLRLVFMIKIMIFYF